MELHEELLFLNEEDVLSLLTPADAIAAAEDTFLHIGLGEITVGEIRRRKIISILCRLSCTISIWQV